MGLAVQDDFVFDLCAMMVSALTPNRARIGLVSG
jgi:hypothetical protein